MAHAKTHTGQVFVCIICNNFSTKVEKNLKQHECCHTKELKYKCRICGKGFVWTQQVKRHICSRKKGGPNFWATRIVQRLREGPKLLTASIKYQVNRKGDEADQPEFLNDPHESR